jgi:adenylate cyclase
VSEIMLEWLEKESASVADLSALFNGFCEALLRAGMPLWRANLGLETLHPDTSGTFLVWTNGAMNIGAFPRSGEQVTASYINSPTRHVDETKQLFRRKLDRPHPDVPLMDELRAQGGTEYCMFPLPFLDTHRTAVCSIATTRAGGFNEEEVALAQRAVNLMSPMAERHVLREIAHNLLNSYLGPTAGKRVYAGQIERGDSYTITAAIWCCDLRGFTTLSETLSRLDTVKLLNRWFDSIGCAVTENGGEILKFMGDGMLAVFPVTETPEETCAQALKAAQQALANHNELNTDLLASGEDIFLRFGLGLHLGDVEFGNIGADERLDFTVIGPAVNQAARLESLTKEIGRTIVFSDSFAAAVPDRLVSLGRYQLRGMAEASEVFGL